uniref:60S ribosomal protein L8-like n=1 Tax=Ciona intestinalis TaxID=7719 RepID=H2XP07_CIOIN
MNSLLSIHLVVVTINILVHHPWCAVMLHLVGKSVSLLQEEPVDCEDPECHKTEK